MFCLNLQKGLLTMKFKYQTAIDELLAQGLSLPELFAPNGLHAYRFVFESSHERNNKPVCVQNPKRVLPNNVRLSGYALSCFNNQGKAEQRYRDLCESFPRTPLTIGDSLSGGELHNEDGMITAPDVNTGHFDLYESEVCDLNKSFKLIERLWRR